MASTVLRVWIAFDRQRQHKRGAPLARRLEAHVRPIILKKVVALFMILVYTIFNGRGKATT